MMSYLQFDQLDIESGDDRSWPKVTVGKSARRWPFGSNDA